MRHWNPRGIRKIDVQAERRDYYRQAREHAPSLRNLWTDNLHRELKPDDLDRLITAQQARGWDDGVRAGTLATFRRIDEALATGRLVKPADQRPSYADLAELARMTASANTDPDDLAEIAAALLAPENERTLNELLALRDQWEQNR
jgi:hypothetical protein